MLGKVSPTGKGLLSLLPVFFFLLAAAEAAACVEAWVEARFWTSMGSVCAKGGAVCSRCGTSACESIQKKESFVCVREFSIARHRAGGIQGADREAVTASLTVESHQTPTR